MSKKSRKNQSYSRASAYVQSASGAFWQFGLAGALIGATGALAQSISPTRTTKPTPKETGIEVLKAATKTGLAAGMGASVAAGMRAGPVLGAVTSVATGVAVLYAIDSCLNVCQSRDVGANSMDDAAPALCAPDTSKTEI